jgi:CAAX prenyl protease-like protein
VGRLRGAVTLTQLPAWLPESYYPWAYSAVVTVVGAVTVGLLRARSVWLAHRHILAAVVIGLVGIALWIGLCRLNLEAKMAPYLPLILQPKTRAGFDPLEGIASPVGRWAFVTFRIAGLAVLVPVAEELFWRGFLARWLVSSDWQSEPLGRFTPQSFALVTLFFTLVHPEWVAAAAYCVLLNGLIYWKRDLWNCVVAHGVSNLVLAFYILSRGAWELW